MPYVPNQLDVYTAAFSGALAGMGGGQPVNPSAGSYAGLCAVAQAFAQEIDTLWGGAGQPTVVEVENLWNISQAAWTGRAITTSAPSFTPGNYTKVATAILAMVAEADANFASEGIASPPFPEGGPPTGNAGGVLFGTYPNPKGAVAEQVSINVKGPPYNAKGDGVTDDTTAIQNAINALLGVGKVGGELYFPKGQYVVSSKIVISNNLGASIHIVGEQGPGVNATGDAAIVWTTAGGLVADTMVQVTGTGHLIENMAFIASQDGINGTLYAVWIQEGLTNISTEEVRFNNCLFSSALGTDSATVAIGTAAGFDVAEIQFSQCDFVGARSGMTVLTDSSVIILGSGNTKEFLFNQCVFRIANRSAIRCTLSLSGINLFLGPVFAACGICDFEIPAVSDGALIVVGGEDEGTNRILYSNTTAQTQNNFIFDGFFWSGTATDDTATFGGAFNRAFADVTFYLQGNLNIRNCSFNNARAGGSEAQIWNNTFQAGNATSITSEGNFFNFSSITVPFMDNAGNRLPRDNIGLENQCRYSSEGDYGFASGNPVHFPSMQGNDRQVGTQSVLWQTTQTAGVVMATPGALAMNVAKFSIDFTAPDFKVAAADLLESLCGIVKKTRIMSIVADTTTAWQGTAGGVTLSVGFTAFAATELLLAHDISTAPTRKGENTADLGTDLAPAANNAFGFIPTWTSDGDQIFAEFKSLVGNFGTGAATNLTQGHTDFYLIFQVLPR